MTENCVLTTRMCTAAQELNEMVPRCYTFLVMMGYWLLHSLIDWNEVEGMRDTHKDALRR
jgi:hypothetical protein